MNGICAAERRQAKVEILDKGGIPCPGKGESEWDCGDNNLQSLHCNAETVEEAIGHVVASVLRTRKRHAGSHTYESRESQDSHEQMDGIDAAEKEVH